MVTPVLTARDGTTQPRQRTSLRALLVAALAVTLVAVAPMGSAASAVAATPLESAASLVAAPTPGAGAPAPIAPATGMDPDRAAALQAALDRIRLNKNIPGMSLAIRLPDGTVWTAVSGQGVLKPIARDVTADMPFSAGSLTKTFVAALVMQEVQLGVIQLGDPISRWLPSYPNGAHIRVAELLSHTSGLYDYFDNPSYDALVFGRPTHAWTLPEILKLVLRPVSKPGKKFDYSNTNFVLLGKILRKATHQSLGALIRGRLLGPLHLDQTAFQDVEPVQLDSAQGYLLTQRGKWSRLSDGSAYRPNTSAATVAWAAGAILSTPGDLVRWAHALYAEPDTVVSAQSVALMTTFNKGDYGFGTERFYTTSDPTTQEPMWGHTGSLRGYEAQVWYVPSRDVTISLLSNRGRVSTRAAIQKLLAKLFAATPG